VTEREKFVVPLRAAGKIAVLSMPDAMSFPTVPVRHAASRTMVIRNVGSKSTPFRILAPSPFAAAPERGAVGPGEHVIVSLTFAPLQADAFDVDLSVTYGDQDRHTVYVNLSGAGTELDVLLSKPSVLMPPTYVTLANNSALMLTNRSEAPVEYRWRAYASEADEAAARQERLAELDEQYALEVRIRIFRKSPAWFWSAQRRTFLLFARRECGCAGGSYSG
jgi:hypothetical protein